MKRASNFLLLVALLVSALAILSGGRTAATRAILADNAPVGGNTFTTAASFSGRWYDTNWQFRKKITIDHTRVSANLTDFPVLINLTSDADLAAHAQASGNDILFTSSDGVTKLSHEIERYTSATGALVAWVRVASLSSTTDTVLYMCYGNPSAPNQQAPTNVWDANYRAVWHLRESGNGTAGEFKDSTSNANNGTGAGAAPGYPTRVAGEVGYGENFPSGDVAGGIYLNCGNNASLQITGSGTIEAWVRPAASGSYIGIAGKITDQNGSPANSGFTLARSNTNYYRFLVGNRTTMVIVNSNSTYTDTGWHHIVGVVSSGTDYLYVDGVQQTATGANAIADSGSFAFIGRQYSNYNQRYWNGVIDEVRISNNVRPAAWISTEYNNQSSPSSFYSLDIEITRP